MAQLLAFIIFMQVRRLHSVLLSTVSIASAYHVRGVACGSCLSLNWNFNGLHLRWQHNVGAFFKTLLLGIDPNYKQFRRISFSVRVSIACLMYVWQDLVRSSNLTTLDLCSMCATVPPHHTIFPSLNRTLHVRAARRLGCCWCSSWPPWQPRPRKLASWW